MHSSHEHKIYILVRTTIHMTHTPHKPPSQSRPSHGFCSKSVLAKSVLVSTCDGLLSTVRGAFITCRRGSPKHLIKILYDQHVQKIKRRNIYIYVITVEARTRTGLRKMIERIFFFFFSYLFNKEWETGIGRTRRRGDRVVHPVTWLVNLDPKVRLERSKLLISWPILHWWLCDKI